MQELRYRNSKAHWLVIVAMMATTFAIGACQSSSSSSRCPDGEVETDQGCAPSVDAGAPDGIESADSQAAPNDGASCTPDCTDKECGDDGCGGSCGGCPEVAPYCVDHACAISCTPQCAGKICGDDGCGNSCGDCPDGFDCQDNTCTCVPACDGASCGDDGCGGSCGTCPGITPHCIEGECSAFCQGDCTDKECGDDGCGGDCGECPQIAPYCVEHACAISCTPQCDFKDCGEDGCGGACGTCPEGSVCEAYQCLCVPNCDGKACGGDGCGGDCGVCVGDMPYCVDDQCTDTCVASCDGKECGDDGCGGDCGICPQVAPYCVEGLCDVTCTPDCSGKQCGDNGCLGICGTCGPSESCSAGICVCVPDCEDKECGEDGCGGTCGACSDDAPYCTEGLCNAECKATCGGKECGPDGCGGVCGTCPDVAPFCSQGTCALEDCTPNCGGKNCGDDGCGGSCGVCPQDYACLPQGICQADTCEPNCQGKQCGSDGCGGSCGICQDGSVCESAVCIDAPADCAYPVIHIQEGNSVIPQTKLHLDGTQSTSPGGSLGYKWAVQQPVGSQSVFLPHAIAAQPTFEANVAGTYIFKLETTSTSGIGSCKTAEYTVNVVANELIHIELLWDTPNDPDQTDDGPEAGADLDLHFLHPFASGLDVDLDGQPDGWFDQPFDCFWFNAHPNWASMDPMIDDDPGLDLDDTDGAGPENINLNLPENAMTYRVGVHYWNDHNFGPSLATVRVYLYSELVFEQAGVELVNHDMWEVATIDWPSGNVELILGEGGGYKITPNYQHPYFFP